MRRRNKRPILISIGIICLIIIPYLMLAGYYRSGFMVNTWINGIYSTGKTAEEINTELIARMTLPEDITVIGYEGVGAEASVGSWQLPVKEMDYRLDYRPQLNGLMNAQNTVMWFTRLIDPGVWEIAPEISVNETFLQEWWLSNGNDPETAEDYRIEYDRDRGYLLYDGLSNRLDMEQAHRAILTAIADGETSVDLTGSGCYYNVSLTHEQDATETLWQTIDQFQQSGPVYNLGDGEWQVDPGSMAQMLVRENKPPYLPILDARGRLQISEEKVTAFIESLAVEHDTAGKDWKFLSTRGETVTVPGGTYGTIMDQETERSWLMEYLERQVAGKGSDRDKTPHTPAYLQEAFCRSSQSLGDTYIEVDMGAQRLYYYEKGELRLDTDIVTGNARRKMDTPEGVNFVYAKQTKRVLRGPDYTTPVDFWMPVKGAIGIHDAKWRKAFGGEIYKTNGSHGCVNIPLAKMKELYGMVEIGTPVIMFYGSEPEDGPGEDADRDLNG